MIAFDTNVLLRLHIADDPVQHASVKRLLSRVAREGGSVWIAVPVLCEMVWVLRRVYDASVDVCIDTIEKMLDTAIFSIESASEVRRACRRCRQGGGDFSDYLIRELSVSHGAGSVYTFDKTLPKEAGFARP